METLALINGNKQQYVVDLPKIVILSDQINDIALAHIFERTGLNFSNANAPFGRGYIAQPTSNAQIVKLLLTYNYKTRYYNNSTHKNTLFLKGDHHIGFDVDSICYECCKRNNISINMLKPGDFLAC